MRLLIIINFYIYVLLSPQIVFAGEVIHLNFNICNKFLSTESNFEIPLKTLLSLTKEGQNLNLDDPRLIESTSLIEKFYLKPTRLSSTMVTPEDFFTIFNTATVQHYLPPLIDLLELRTGRSSADFSELSRTWEGRKIDILNSSISYLALHAHRNPLPTKNESNMIETTVRVNQVTMIDSLSTEEFEEYASRIVRFPQWRNSSEKYFQVLDPQNSVISLAAKVGKVNLVIDVAGLGSRRSLLEMTQFYSEVLYDEGYLMLWLPTSLYFSDGVQLLNIFSQNEVDVFSNIPDFTLVGLYQTPKLRFTTMRLEHLALNTISPPYEGISVLLKRNQRGLPDLRRLLPFHETLSPEGVRKLSVGLSIVK